MKPTFRSLFIVAVGLLLLLALMTGCYREVAPDVDTTPTADASGELSQEDVMATAIARTTRVAQELGEEAADETPEATEPTTSAVTPEPTEEPAPVITAAPTFTPVPPPTEAPASTTDQAASATTDGQTTHVVQSGENLFRIALRYGTSVQAISSANGIANPSQISVGQQLIIPGATTSTPAVDVDSSSYVVQNGDNLFRIALR
jgi:LysM repeat protein